MGRTKRIAIILSDTLQSIGLQSILTDFFMPVEITLYTAFDTLSESQKDTFDYYFTDSETFVFNSDFFLPRRNKTVVLFCNEKRREQYSFNNLNSCSSQETILEQLQQLFTQETNNTNPLEGNKELSTRETDVLQLIVKGHTNKEIAERLNISLNTVLTHRKNITSKLGIKTVSGLTFYAIMNGIISGDEIEL
ncbi:response regulator transcription factor [Parabacteroides sp. PF5-9]|uniref:response regulator transcription factor n=1 Tax=Parabacteroides sp. PF5-9 TaxID=1742404 RepID=UPI002473E884|nr:response regulator transcription factor [Parabacteroides sp. PF5-9]MDH6358148.1 DNA-binding CsgD family transcriptional regulator [Parabacteroides sp. PF5-9]